MKTQNTKPFLSVLFTVGFLLISGCEQKAQANPEGQIKELTDLQTLSIESNQNNLPILLTFGAEWCEFCEQLKEEVLDPMALGGLYEGKYVYLRYVSIDDHSPIPGIDGKPTLKGRWAESYGADLTPTVLFIDGNGNEVAPRIVGISNIELYSAMIHRALNTAYEKMENSLRIPAMPEQLQNES